MISRRALRIRAFQFLFSFFKQDPSPSLEIIKRQYFQSLDKSYSFYLLMLSLLDEFRIMEINEIQKQKNKFIKSDSNYTPVFSNHPFILALSGNKEFYQKLNEHKVSFGKDQDWIHSVYKTLKKEKLYINYVGAQDFSKEKALSFMKDLVENFLYNNEFLEHFFDEESQFAQDDLYLSLNMVSKTIEEFDKTDTFVILPPYRDEKTDKKFAEDLLRYTTQNYHIFDDYINKYSENWDLERINYSDLLLLKMCLAELIYMPDIPLKTSVDEYIEISKEYSSPQSYTFINGILVGIIKDLSKNEIIKKTI